MNLSYLILCWNASKAVYACVESVCPGIIIAGGIYCRYNCIDNFCGVWFFKTVYCHCRDLQDFLYHSLMLTKVTPHMAKVTPTLGQLWPFYFLTKNELKNQPIVLTITWQIDKGKIFIYNLQKYTTPKTSMTCNWLSHEKWPKLPQMTVLTISCFGGNKNTLYITWKWYKIGTDLLVVHITHKNVYL